MSEFGTFIVDRSVFSHAAFERPPFTELEAWLWLVAAATKRPRDLRKNHIVIKLERGQLCYSHRFIAKRWDWTVARVQRFLSRLVAESMIVTCVSESAPSHQPTVITIRNYDKFQGAPPERAVENESPPSQIRETLSSDSRDSVVDEGVARARESTAKISKEASQLADEVMIALGIDLKFVPPPWMGFALWVQAGLAGGWQPHLVRLAAARLRARKNYSVPFSFKYLDRPIHREHQLAADTPLPIPPVMVSSKQEVARGSHQNTRSGIAAIDRVFDRVSAMRPADHPRQDEDTVRRLPPRSISGS